MGKVEITDETRLQFLKRYDDWHAVRTVIGEREESPDGDDPVSGDDWYNSDRDGIELMHDLASLLRAVDECGCKDVDVTTVCVPDIGITYTVSCTACPNVWTVRNGEVPQVHTFADAMGNWQASVTEYGVGNAAAAAQDALEAITRELVERGIDPDAIAARMSVEVVGRTSQHGKLETQFTEVWAHPEA